MNDMNESNENEPTVTVLWESSNSIWRLVLDFPGYDGGGNAVLTACHPVWDAKGRAMNGWVPVKRHDALHLHLSDDLKSGRLVWNGTLATDLPLWQPGLPIEVLWQSADGQRSLVKRSDSVYFVFGLVGAFGDDLVPRGYHSGDFIEVYKYEQSILDKLNSGKMSEAQAKDVLETKDTSRPVK